MGEEEKNGAKKGRKGIRSGWIEWEENRWKMDEIDEWVRYEKDGRARDHKWYGKWCKSKEWIVDENNEEKMGW